MLRAPGAALRSARRRVSRDATELPLRPGARRGPHRGSGAHSRLRQHPGRAAAWPGAHARAPEARARITICAWPWPAAGYQEVVNFSFRARGLGGGFRRRSRAPIRVLNPIASQHSVMRSKLVRQPGRMRCATTSTARRAACALFELARVFRARSAQARRTGPRSSASRSRASWQRWPTGRPPTSNGACRRARSTFSTSRATSSACCFPRRRISRRLKARRERSLLHCIPDAALRRARWSRRSAGSGNCTRALCKSVRPAGGAGSVRGRGFAACCNTNPA
jgi:hypothetical protein